MKKVIALSALSLLIILPGCVNVFKRRQPVQAVPVEVIATEQPAIAYTPGQEYLTQAPADEEIIGELELPEDADATFQDNSNIEFEEFSSTAAAWNSEATSK